ESVLRASLLCFGPCPTIHCPRPAQPQRHHPSQRIGVGFLQVPSATHPAEDGIPPKLHAFPASPTLLRALALANALLGTRHPTHLPLFSNRQSHVRLRSLRLISSRLQTAKSIN